MYPEAIAEAEKGLALDPKWSAMLNKLGFVYISLGRYRQGGGDFEKEPSPRPGRTPTPWIPWGSSISIPAGSTRRSSAYKQAIKVKPDFGSEEIIAYIQAVKGNYAEALSWIDQFILMAPTKDKKGRGYWWKAIFNHLSGRRGQAKAEMERFQGFAESLGTTKRSCYPSPRTGKPFSFLTVATITNAVRCLSQGQQVILDPLPPPP